LSADGLIIFKQVIAVVQVKLNYIFMSDVADFVVPADDLPQSYNHGFSNTRTGLSWSISKLWTLGTLRMHSIYPTAYVVQCHVVHSYTLPGVWAQCI